MEGLANERPQPQQTGIIVNAAVPQHRYFDRLRVIPRQVHNPDLRRARAGLGITARKKRDHVCCGDDRQGGRRVIYHYRCRGALGRSG